jgi:hypothetical protein
VSHARNSSGSPGQCAPPRGAGRLGPGLLGALAFIGLLLGGEGSRLSALVINEIHYHPPGSREESRRQEFLELYNEEPDPLDLTGYYFSDGVDFVFRERTFLAGYGYLVVCADEGLIRSLHGITNTAGSWSASTALSNGGERLTLNRPGGGIAATVRYGDRGRWPAGAGGTGHTLALKSPLLPLDDPESWALSFEIGGTPGRANFPGPPPEDAASAVRFNEAYLHGSAPRWVELYNPGEAAADLSTFFLTDAPGNLTKARLPAGTVVPARGWLVLEDAPLGLDFSIEGPPAREVVFVALVDPEGRRVLDAFNFEASPAAKSAARLPDGHGLMVPAAEPTPGAANRAAASRDIIINEIHYHPMDDDPAREFVELFNRGLLEVDLGGWRFTEGIRYEFPAGTALLPGGYLVVARQPARIRAIYGLESGQVVGPAPGSAEEAAFGVLANGGERLTLCDASGNVVKSVDYRDGGEWPEWADGGGSTLELIDPFQDNSSPQAWDASDDSAKAETRTFEYRARQAAASQFLESEIHIMNLDRGIVIVDDLHIPGPATTELVTDTAYLEPQSDWRLFKGTEEPLAGWGEPAFDDAAWLPARLPVGYGEPGLETVLDDMRRITAGSGYMSFYLRGRFELADPAAVERLVLEIDFDDGFVAYLNGSEVARSNIAGTPPAFDAAATVGRESGAPLLIHLDSRRHLLHPGANLCALQVHNDRINSPDAYCSARLFSGRLVDVPAGWNKVPGGDFEAPLDSEWLIEGTHIHSGRTTERPISGTGSLKVVATGAGDMKVNRIEREIPTGLIAGAEYTVSLKARWVVGSASLLTMGNSFGLARSHALHVPENAGTPGAENSVTRREIERTGSANIGPVIDGVTQDPALPGAGQPTRVRARITDADGVASATLRYASRSAAGPFTAVPMSGPDARGVYEAVIPGQPLGTIIVYEIAALDAGGREGRYPLDPTRRTHPLLLDAAAARPQDRHWAAYGHQLPAAGPFPTYQVWLTREDELHFNTRRVHSDDYLRAALAFAGRDGEAIYQGIGFRLQGSALSRGHGRNFRIRMADDRPFAGRVRRFNLDSDGLSARERLTNYLIRSNTGDERVAYLSHTYTVFHLNLQPIGVRERKTPPGKEFVSEWFPDDDRGDLFELDERSVFNDSGTAQNRQNARWLHPPYAEAGAPDDKESYRHWFNTRLNRGADDYTRLIETARILDPARTPGPIFDEEAPRHLNIEQFLRVLAIRQNTGDFDTWGSIFGRSAYVYRPFGDGRWHLFPWDMDITYGVDGRTIEVLPLPSDPRQPIRNANFPEIERLLNRPRFRRLYYSILKEMIDNHFGSAYLAPYLTLLRNAGATPESLAGGAPGGWIDRRAALLRGWLESSVHPAKRLEIRTNGGLPFATDAASVALDGDAPVEVTFIAIIAGGEAPAVKAEFSSSDIFGWSVAGVPLRKGENDIQVFGFDRTGRLVDSAAIRITRPAGTALFVRGDADLDGMVGLTDAIRILGFLFQGGTAPCLDAADVDDSGQVDITDAIRLLNYLFLGDEPPPPPFPEAGPDPTEDELDCAGG